MRFLQSFIQGVIVAILPLLIVGFSIAFTLPNASIHKDSLIQENFYQKLNDQLKKNYANTPGSNQILGYLIVGPVVDRLVTPDWLKDVSEKNIDFITRWLNGDSNILTFYLPTSDIENAVRSQLDIQTDKLVRDNSLSIPECDNTEVTKLKTEGYDPSQTFCLPKEVKNGSKKLSDVLDITQQSGFNSLDSIIKNNPVSSLSDQVRADSVISGANQVTLSRLNWFRDQFIAFRGQVLIFFIIFMLVLTADITLVVLSKKKVIAHIRRLFWFISTSTLSLCVFWLVLIGGVSYLGSSLNLLILPGFATTEIVNLLSWNLLRLAFNLVYPAILISVLMLFVNLVVLILERLNLFSVVKVKNAKLANKPVASPEKNPTLDGQFKTMLNININTNSNSPKPTHFEKPEEEFSLNNYPRGYKEPAAPVNSNVPLVSNEGYSQQNLEPLAPEIHNQAIPPTQIPQQYPANPGQTSTYNPSTNIPNPTQNIQYPNSDAAPTTQPNNVVETDSTGKKFLG